MDFFDKQSRAKRRTGWLILIYAVFVVGLVAAVHSAISFLGALLVAEEHGDPSVVFKEIATDPEVLLFTAGSLIALIGIASLVKTIQLAQGGPAVAKAMDGREVLPNTRDFRERRLLNIVEEMALASGVAMPRVYVMDDEPGVNAFAAGYSPKDSAIAVTRGALELFNRDELQAVVGHEFSHILNGDMRLNIRMIGVLFGILCISLLGNLIFRGGARMMSHSGSRSRNKKDDAAGAALAVMAFGVVVWLLGSLGVLCSRLIQAMISRQREYLADSSAVQFTRNPDAMADALKVIGAATHGSRIANPRASEVSHMLFASGLGRNLFATHPPLNARIREIDPRFDGDFNEAKQVVRRRMAMRLQQTEADEEETIHHRRLLHILAATTLDEAPAPTAPIGAPAISPAPPPLPQAPADWLSEEERETLRTVEGAEACFLGALLATDPETRREQLKRIAASKGDLAAAAAGAWRERLAPLGGSQRRLTCETAVNTLRPQERKALEETAKLADAVVMADGQVDPFEFAMTRLFRARLLPDARASRRSETISRESAAHVLHVLAAFGAADRAQADRAWQAGAAKLASFGSLEPLQNVDATDLTRFDKALKELVRLPAVAKREFMQACQAVASADGALNETEQNFLFAIADVIEATGWNTAAAAIKAS
ncbi:MAG: M48 family metallopeptidase [Kiritimatiellia bacterium]